MTVLVLDQMQMLDQQVAAARPVGQQAADFLQRRGCRPDGPWGSCGLCGRGLRSRQILKAWNGLACLSGS